MKTVSHGLVVLFATFAMLSSSFAMAPRPSRAAEEYAVKAPLHEVETHGDWKLFEARVQEGAQAIDTFTMSLAAPVRSVEEIASGHPRGIVLLVPGGNSNFKMYMPDHQTHLVADLLKQGYWVYGYSPRSRGLSANDANNPRAKYWNSDVYAADVSWIRNWIEATHHLKPVVGGMSLGSILAHRVIGENPTGYAGALLMEGTVSSDLDAVSRNRLRTACNQTRQALAGGVYFESQSTSMLQQMVGLAMSDPNGASPIQSELTNQQMLFATLTSPQDPPQSLTPGYHMAAGDVASGLRFSNIERVSALAQQMNALDPLALTADLFCAFSGEENSYRLFMGNLSRFERPVFTAEAGLSFAAYYDHTASLLNHATVTRFRRPQYGHGDIFGSDAAISDLNQAISAWLKQVYPNSP